MGWQRRADAERTDGLSPPRGESPVWLFLYHALFAMAVPFLAFIGASLCDAWSHRPANMSAAVAGYSVLYVARLSIAAREGVDDGVLELWAAGGAIAAALPAALLLANG